MNKKGTKHAFWQAFVLAVIVFGSGLVLGFFLEISRGNDVEKVLLNSELDLLDEQLRNRVVEDFSIGCDAALKSTYNFADKIYLEAVKLEKYDANNKFGNVLKLLHKRYDLLRLMMWSEARSLKEKCNGKFHTIVYLYNYDIDDISNKAVQTSIGRLLSDFKESYGQDVLLIPLAGNLGIDSIELIKVKYNISELPVVIVDEKIVLKGPITIDELEKAVFG